MSEKQYILRKAAGIYWLLDRKQPGVPYKAPLQMNQMGAEIWKMYESGKSKKEIIRLMCMEYDADIELVEKDVSDFLLQLEQYGIRKVQ